jgi:hypothetical protein
VNLAYSAIAPVDPHTQTPTPGRDDAIARGSGGPIRQGLERDPTVAVLFNMQDVSRALFRSLSVADDGLGKLAGNLCAWHKLSDTDVALTHVTTGRGTCKEEKS